MWRTFPDGSSEKRFSENMGVHRKIGRGVGVSKRGAKE